MTAHGDQDPVIVGRLELRPTARAVLLDGHPVVVGGRGYDILDMLVRQAGHLVAQQDLMAEVWAGRRVEANNLQVQIRALRRTLGRETIVTVSGRGYQLTWTHQDEALPV